MKRKLLFESLIGGKLFKLYAFKGISLGHINFVEDTMRRKTLSISVLCLTIELFYYGR
tara:strand:- start:320 stop:493 length:174 start_codon:yes stop_codon:yes gene_type:complete